VIEAKPKAQAACGKGVVIDLDPHGDGFLAVKAGPGLHFARLDKLYNGEQIYLCMEAGDWYGIVYTNETQDCNLDREWPLTQPYTGPCRSGWAHRRWIKSISSKEREKANPAPTQEATTEQEQIEQLLAAARKQKKPGILKEFLLSHAGIAAREQIRKTYLDLSDHVQSHPFGVVDRLKIYEKPDIQSRVVREESVGKAYILVRQEGDFDYIEYDLNEYGYIYRGFLH
jgi:hypothetical protein